MKSVSYYFKSYFRYQKGCGLAKSTMKRNSYYLERFSSFTGEKDFRELGPGDIIDYLAYLKTLKNNRGEPLKESSIRVELSNLKMFFDWLHRSDFLLTNPMEDIETIKTRENTDRKIFSEEDINTFLDAIGIRKPIEQRDRALFELLYSSGLRISEALELKEKDLNLEDRICFVVRKGGKEEYVPFSKTALQFLLKYIREGRNQFLKMVRKPDLKQYLFLTPKGKMTSGAARRRFAFYLKQSGLENKAYVIHSIRHATATHLIVHGVSIRYVQELLGHESLNTTQLYTRPNRESVKAVYRSYHPRENRFYREIDQEYLQELQKLKKRLIWQKNETRKRREKSE